MQNRNFLDRANDHFNAGRANVAMDSIVTGLGAVRKEKAKDDWVGFVSEAKEHPSLKTALLCPFTKHAATRPFGYPGDARLMDHIYGYARPCLNGLPQSIYQYTTSAPASRAVRYRRHILASSVDKVLHDKHTEAEILAVACGYLRELDVSSVLQGVRPQKFIALDQDANGLAEVERCFSNAGITPEHKKIKDILTGSCKYEGLDLVYSAGLYDYLNTEIAQCLTQSLFNMLAPGGTLLTANFLPDIYDVGFMEAVMDWWLVYRDEKDMLALLRDIPESEIASIKQYRDPDDNITFLELRKQ